MATVALMWAPSDSDTRTFEVTVAGQTDPRAKVALSQWLFTPLLVETSAGTYTIRRYLMRGWRALDESGATIVLVNPWPSRPPVDIGGRRFQARRYYVDRQPAVALSDDHGEVLTVRNRNRLSLRGGPQPGEGEALDLASLGNDPWLPVALMFLFPTFSG